MKTIKCKHICEACLEKYSRKNREQEAAINSLITQRYEHIRKLYEKLGFDFFIPEPQITDEEYKQRQVSQQELFYRPASSLITYEAFMQANGQGDHWTVTDEKERAKIGFEPTATGYWFWAEAASKCPRIGTSRNDLMKKIHLLSLEEYVIVWHMTKTIKNVILDPDSVTWTWLRTSYDGSGALGACGYCGVVRVAGSLAGGLARAGGGVGGRLAEVVKD